MALFNASHGLGEPIAKALEGRLEPCSKLQRLIRPVDTDNRMHAWEWLVVGETLVKTDALDHSRSHDLVGHQDISWDVAGAIVELGLSAEEAGRLCAVVAREGGCSVDPDLLAFMFPCYLAFHMGSCLMAADALRGAAEAARLESRAKWYAARLTRLLDEKPLELSPA